MGIHANVSRPHIGFSHSAIIPQNRSSSKHDQGTPVCQVRCICASALKGTGLGQMVPYQSMPYPVTEAALFLPDKQGNRLDMIGLGKKVHRLDLL